MHGDFSLNPTHYRDRVSRVLQQMGRVQLDSDWNEQTESTLRFLRGLGSDVIGTHGGLLNGFKIVPETQDPTKAPFRIMWGQYYVDGIRCVNMPNRDFWDMAGDVEWRKILVDGALRVSDHEDSHWPKKQEGNPDRPEQLIYLAVWERHISSAEDDSIREVALLGPDTSSRAVVVWQIRATPAKEVFDLAKEVTFGHYDPNYLALNLLLRSSARMKARAIINQKLEPCLISPEARYRGQENRLYRVEIHHDPDTDVPPHFKWSPDNAAIVYPVRAPIEGKVVRLESMGRDERTAIRKNDWVEIVDDESSLRRKSNSLLQVVDVDRHRMTVTLSAEPADQAGDRPALHPILRRWADEPQEVKEDQWIELSDGVEVNFSHVDMPKGGYRNGDYWLIPTRTATGDVIWPGTVEDPHALAPHGVDEHYAPLASWKGGAGTAGAFTDLRWKFDPLAKKV